MIRMSSSREHDYETIPNLPTALVTNEQFNIRTWFISIIDSLLIGFLGGLASVGFYYLIQLCSWFFFTFLGTIFQFNIAGTNLSYLFLPAIGGAIIGPVMMRYAPEVRGEGIPEVMEVVVLKDVTIRKRVGLFKAIASAITIGSGGSAGREGPIAQIGSSVGSTIAQVFKLDRSRARHMIICGFAAGLAGIFNAPLGGAIFSIEVLGGTIVVLDMVPVFIAAAVAAIVHTWILGPAPMFPGASMGSIILPEYWFVMLLGLILGILAVFWHTFFVKTRRLVDRIKIDSKYKPILGGIVTGCLGIFFVNEGIFGLGHEGVDGALILEYSIGLLFLLAFAKMLATAFTLTTGGSGGLFQPTLYIGTMLGGGFGLLFAYLSPQTVTDPSLFAIIGMGALFAGAAQCPINTIIMIPELTGNYNLIFPQLVASMISYVVFRVIKRGSSIYTAKLEERGVPLKMGGEIDLSRFKVSEIMVTGIPVIESKMMSSELEDFYLTHKFPLFPVVDGGKLVGTVSINRVFEMSHEAHEVTPIADILTKEPVTITPETTVQAALNLLIKTGASCLPVINKESPNKIAGIVTLAEIHEIYDRFHEDNFKENK